MEWLKARIDKIPIRLCFESALELMSVTRVGSFSMAQQAPGKKSGPPPIVKKVLGLFGSQVSVCVVVVVSVTRTAFS